VGFLFVLFCFFETGSLCVAQAGLKLKPGITGVYHTSGFLSLLLLTVLKSKCAKRPRFLPSGAQEHLSPVPILFELTAALATCLAPAEEGMLAYCEILFMFINIHL
jgi:hypothetical protein